MNQSFTKINDNLLNYAIGEKLDVKNIPLVGIKDKIKFNEKVIRLRKITKIVFDKDEDNIEKLTTVFNAVNSVGSDIVYIFDNKDSVLSFYIGVVYDSGENNGKLLNDANKTLEKVFSSHFNGCDISEHLNENDIKSNKIENIFINKNLSVSMSTAIPSLKNEDEKKENFVQGMEKFLLGMQDKNYTAILLAKNISDMVEIRKNGYEELYTSLFPLITKDVSFGVNQSNSEGTSLSKSINESTTKTLSNGKSKSTQTPSYLQKVQMSGVPFSGLASTTYQKLFKRRLDLDTNKTKTPEERKQEREEDKLLSKEDRRLKRNNDNFISENNAVTENEANGTTKGVTSTNSINTNYTTGKSLQTTIKYEDKFFKNKIDAIDMQLDRIKQSQNYGMYDFAAYFISDNISTSNTAANIYNALIRGDESFLGHSYIQTFNQEDSQTVCKYLANFKHPKFDIDGEDISITSMINSKELAIAMNLPKKSLHGLYIKESAEFSREIIGKSEEDSIKIGKNYHLGKSSSHDVELPINDFSMHTLITGATGSGKSTTTYKLIDELRNKDIKFLVIEPTKGEYKHIFGNEKDVSVFGTNDKFTPLLKINPFNFPTGEIHILEHIDRLVEIFNACWPMYAAMPAVLKDAILSAYENCGWDLDDSASEDMIFPTFDDVLESLEDIMESSSYSDNTKSDYKGALSTRIESLTKGLVGKIFDEDELSDEKLFDENVIVDISRVGSSETKSLIMGILLLKLNQYRIAKGSMNSDLKHTTVLEEAHHLLPRTSTESSGESGNIKGKAVEMLSNAIAEMRTYGEGFIIVDQSPNMLDISAIRNTNTKIIMRLSELEDRNDIGKSATLTDEQIEEIPKLERGVAVVYQNGWEEAILSKIQISDIEKEYNEKDSKDKKYNYNKAKVNFNKKEILTNVVKLIALSGTNILAEEREIIEKGFRENKNLYQKWSGNNKLKIKSLEYIENDLFSIEEKAKLINYLLNGKKILRKLNNINTIKIDFIKYLQKQINISNEIFQYQIMQLIKIDNSYKPEDMINNLEEILEQNNLIIGVK